MKTHLLHALALLGLLTLATTARTAELTTELPPPQVEGTPVEIKGVPNLLTESGPAKLDVPDGTTLLSKGKKVTSSDDFPVIGELTFITDGDKESGDGYFVELGAGKQWVQIDLEKESEISAIWLWHYHAQRERAYHDVIVQISSDPEFKTGVTTVFNNDYDNSSGLGKGEDRPYAERNFGKLIAVKAVKGRYIRLYSKGNTSNDMNHYVEVEIFGKA